LNINDSRQSESALHVADTANLRLLDSTLSNIVGGAVDLQFSTITIDNLEVIKVGKDAITLRGAQASLRNLQVLGWGGVGIAVSQRSNLTVKDTLLAAGNRGISVNEASTMQFDGILLYRDEVGLDFEQTSDWYSERAHIRGDQLYAVDCKTQMKREGASRKTTVQFKGRPRTGELEGLRAAVMGSDSWDALDDIMGKRLRGGDP
jgi:hypothetical protein